MDRYESLTNTPDDLLLFFHHVPYTYRLHSGSTVIQMIYDAHYAGAEKVKEFVKSWKSLRCQIDDERYEDVLQQLEYQAGHAIVWRDAINNWFRRMSEIPDDKHRVGHHPNRVEAETMTLKGYKTFEPASWEGASGGRAVVCPNSASSCSAQTRFEGAPGWYEVDVEYFDLSSGFARFEVFVGDQAVDQWSADKVFPGTMPSADSSVRRRIRGLALRPGDEIRVTGIPDGGDPAGIDYIEVIPLER
jgi:alpha-glucuronidase